MKRIQFGRTWTEDELEKLREWYRVVPAREIARRLGRTRSSVYHAARFAGLRFQSQIKIDRHFLAGLRRLNKQGYPDAAIAREIGCERHTVSRHRRALGLPSHQYGERQREVIRAATLRQCEAAGVDSLGEFRALVLRTRAIQAGWPADLRWRSVQILGLLEERGPMTRRQIAEALGMPWRGSRKSLASNDPEGSYLANLQKRGLVVRLGRVVTAKRGCDTVNLYSITVTAQRNATP